MKKFYQMTILCLHNPTRAIMLLCAIAMLAMTSKVNAQSQTKPLQGVVVNEKGEPFVGVTVIPVGSQGGAVTGARGDWRLLVPRDCDSLQFSFTGYVRKTVFWKDAMLVKMQVDEQVIDNVIVTGVYTRKAESYTGASVSVSGDALRKLGNQNILQSLKYADPTVYIADNLAMGSDPNSLPSISMRGTSSLPTATTNEIKGNYQSDPNQPLFVLDGFETTAEKVMDMDMNRVQSVTILKDAAAKALYGSKAANGVIVIETKQIKGNQQLVTYNFSLDLEMPDLTSYNLCNAAQKLEVERIEGVYDALRDADQQFMLDELYNSRKKLILEGLDTYWLAKPLRLGVGHKHNLSVELGDSESLRNIIDFTYNDNAGVMKGSNRETIEGNINTSYRYKKITFRNIANVTSNKSTDSPYGDFGTYATMNPYLSSNDPVTGELLRWSESMDPRGNMLQIPNPMYDATIGTTYKSSYLNFSDNFYAEYQLNEAIKITGRLGVDLKRSDANEFLPAQHSAFADLYSNEDKGSYDYESGKSSSISGDLYFNYNKSFGKHSIYATAGGKVSETQYSVNQFSAEGFANLQSADMSFARQYAEGSTPVSIASLNRELSFLGNVSYDYDNRLLADFTLRESASSLFGSDNRWATSWAVGLGWNLHNESFLENVSWVKQLKLRGSVGITGNQNFATNEALATYRYYTDLNYTGLTGAYLNNMPNPGLRWEQKYDMNIGFDARIHGLSMSFDLYNSETENMLTNITIPTSTGFETVKDNLGRVRNYGIEASLSYNVLTRAEGYVNVFGNVATTNNEIVSLSESLKNYNERMMSLAEDRSNSTPVLIYQDGLSMNTIWAVPSAGIDPSTGKEYYIKKDGSLTYEYSSDDLVAAGDATIKYRGNFGFNGEWKGIGLSLTMSYYAGGQMYNTTLVERVENVDIAGNVDARVLTGRWQEPGQKALYKLLGTYNVDGISTQEVTRSTTRFVQNRNELHFSSLNLYYEFPTKMIENLKLRRLRASFFMNNFATISSIDVERGLSYPFARTMSLALSATF